MVKKYASFTLLISFLLIFIESQAQDRLYPNEFPLDDVVLLDGPFKHARDLNLQTLLKYDVDRLLAPFRKEAGLPLKAELFPNWAGLDGHVGGHYLTAMAMNYAATGNAECKRRMEYMISEIRACQEANGKNHPDWGIGYVGGVPDSKTIWSTLQKGDFSVYRSKWVPWYNVHKLFAGLRDAWSYTGNEEAREIFLRLCDWAINITSALSEEQMESMLDMEHGGMNETLADAFRMTGDEKYLAAAKRFSHRKLLDPMSAGIDSLDNRHANTQIPKAVGFQRIAELSGDRKYAEAGSFFWETVTGNRSLAFGGNSRREHFPSEAACMDYIEDIEGPESCNSYNMLKLTEHLFRNEHLARYADYYERTLYNHILSTQHPEHGGYVYFTPARPRHYRVYSAPNQAMWCCVGSGMENHGKYNQFIYTHNEDSLFLNLFISSELDWKEKGIMIRQETRFPYEEQTTLRVKKGSGKFKLMIRYPGWVKEGEMKILVNGKSIPVGSGPSSYVALDRKWKRGDRIQIILPMHTRTEQLVNVPDYVAFMHGPVMLAAKTGNEDLKGLVADDSRWGHIPSGKKLPVEEAPILIGNDISSITGKLAPVKDQPLSFTLSGIRMLNPVNAVLEPFAGIHDSRYVMYWKVLPDEEPATMQATVGTTGKTDSPRPEGPCDIYTAAGFPCVTAHSTTRALYSSYNGPLYQVMRQSDGKTLDIGLLATGKGDQGVYADAAAQDDFCAGTLCRITTVYDQSGNANHLYQAPPGLFRGPDKGGYNTLPIADMAPITINGNKAYGVYIIPGMGLRNNNATGLAIDDEPEGIYMVFDGTHFDSGCCFNYGNTSTNSRAVGRGTMETVYFGTATAWGSGEGTGPWIMSDMEAGLFSGYDAKLNIANPTIDSWRFVTGVVNGGGGNQWDLRGGNARQESLATFYSGYRPGSLENNNYYPMHRKGAVQLGNGGDNGNGSAGTFYEGVMTRGYPTDDAINAVQANIASARYDVPLLSLSRITTFTPASSQEVTVTFTNTTGTAAKDVLLQISLPEGWKTGIAGTGEPSKRFSESVMPGASVKAAFTVTSSAATGGGYLTGRALWYSQGTEMIRSAISSLRLRNVAPVKINEIRFETGGNPTNQFIELYNASDADVDISGWSLINTRSMWAPVKLATIPAGTKIKPHGFYLLGLSVSGLAAPANRGGNVINVLSTDGFGTGQTIRIEGESHTVATVGTAASPMAIVFVPVPTGPWLTIPAGSTNLPVTDTEGFKVGEKIGIDIGGNYETATVTAVGKAATLTNLAGEAKAGDTVIRVVANSGMTVGDALTVGTGGRKELVEVKRLITISAAPARGISVPFRPSGTNPGEVELTTPLRFDHMTDEDVTDTGTGISFEPATRFDHRSGDAVQALGSGITLESALEKNHEAGAPVNNPLIASAGYQGPVKPDQLYGMPLSPASGSIALMDGSGNLVVDAMVYGSQQSNSSANGTIPSPELATLEGDQSQGGCMVVVPGTGFSGQGMALRSTSMVNRSIGRFPDGNDTDSNCDDFLLQDAATLLLPATAGSNNIKVGSATDFKAGQKVFIGSGSDIESMVIEAIGTSGGTTVISDVNAGATAIPVAGIEGFSEGQTITVGSGTNIETAVVASVTSARGRPGVQGAVPAQSVTVTSPLTKSHVAGALVTGSGITLASPLKLHHDRGSQVASNVPTPGKTNQYAREQ